MPAISSRIHAASFGSVVHLRKARAGQRLLAWWLPRHMNAWRMKMKGVEEGKC